MKMLRYAAILALALLTGCATFHRTPVRHAPIRYGVTSGGEVGSYPNATTLNGSERILADQSSSGYPCASCTVNLTPAQIVAYFTTGSFTIDHCIQVASVSPLEFGDAGAACGTGGSSAFGSLTGGTNTTAAMIVGTGASFAIAGSSTGATTIASANANTTNYTATLPANTGTIAELNLAQTFSATQTFSVAPILSSILSAACLGTASNGQFIPATTCVTTTGSPASGNIAAFSAPATVTAATSAQIATALSSTPQPITVASCTGCGSGSSVTLQTNGTNNSSQTALNLENGPGIIVTNLSTGNVQFSSTAPSRTVTTSPTVASTDMGGVIWMNVSGGGTLTIPAIGSGVFGSGQSLLVVNYSASTAAVSTTPTINAGGGCVSGTGIPAGDAWTLVSNGTTLDCTQSTPTSSGSGTQKSPLGVVTGTVGQGITTGFPNGGVFTTFAGTLKNLYARAASPPASGQTYTFTVQIATTPGTFVNTSVTCTITSSSSNNECSDTTDTASIAAGNQWIFSVTTSATSGSTGAISTGLELDH